MGLPTHALAGMAIRSRAQQAQQVGSPYFQQRRPIFIGFQGSGVARDSQSSVKTLHDNYRGPFKALIAGPGKSGFRGEWFGAKQTDEGQRARLDEAKRKMVQAHDRGDRTVHIAGHSRGSGNANLLLQELHHQGLVCPDTGRQVRPPGFPVQSFVSFDSVPHMGGAGSMKVHGPDGPRTAPYEHHTAGVPASVENYAHFLAGGERRNEFRQADMPASGATSASFTIVPKATHKDVGGNPSGDSDAVALTQSEANRFVHRVSPQEFDVGAVLPAGEHNRRLERKEKTAPKRGLIERAISLWSGSRDRNFPAEARPMERRSEDSAAAASERPGSSGSGQ